MTGTVDKNLTLAAQRKYDRIAPVYDLVEWMMEWRASRWRRDLWSRIGRGTVLELGVGTGKNFPHYPPGREIVALDVSEGMLARARRRAMRLASTVRLQQGDVQSLPFPDGSFGVVVATFLFCSVPDPVAGLVEARRVLAPGGQLLLLEHVLSSHPVARSVMRSLDPIPFHLWGAHIDRDTVSNVRRAGFSDVAENDLSFDVVKHLEARNPA